MKKNIKFRVGTVVNKSGYRGVVSAIRNSGQRYVKLSSGEVVVGVEDLKYWKKRRSK